MSTDRLRAVIIGLALGVGVMTAMPVWASADAVIDSPADIPGPRPQDPDADCVTGGADIVEQPAPQLRLDPDGAWLISRGAGVTVAVLDSGVDPTNPQLSAQVDAGVDTVFPGATGNADCLGQGTAVAGLIAAAPTDGIGFHGVAPAARIFPVRVVEDDLQASPSAIADGLLAAVDAGARVVLITVTTPSTSKALDAAIASATAADVLLISPAVVVADTATYAFPAADKEVLAVGAADEVGAAMDEAVIVPPIIDLVAPGAGVVSTLPVRGHTTAVSGSVAAAAYVAGVAALVRSAYPDLTAARVRSRLELTADRPGTQPPDPLLGWGAVNPEVALSAVIPTETRAGGPAGDALVVPPPRDPVAADLTTEHRAIWIFGLGGALAVATLLAVLLVPRGRRTGWRPARSSTALARKSS